MYLSRLTLNHSRPAMLWAANPYRIHQRLLMGCESDPRLLFRIEDHDPAVIVLVQTHTAPDWLRAFSDFPVLAAPVQAKAFDLHLQIGGTYRFRLLANPAVKKTVERPGGEKGKTRQGLMRSDDQIAWLRGKLEAAGAELCDCLPMPQGLLRSHKNPARDERTQTHLGVLFDGLLRCTDMARLIAAVAAGIGPAKAYGFGLLSLARPPV